LNIRLSNPAAIDARRSGAYRLSGGPYYPYHDVVPFAPALVEADASHMVWGSDSLHSAVSGFIPKNARLLDLLAVLAPDAEMRRRILTENPAQLYGFQHSGKRPDPQKHDQRRLADDSQHQIDRKELLMPPHRNAEVAFPLRTAVASLAGGVATL
jgi:hypothetical protein